MHPDARHLLRDASRALWFTEGSKKADALWSRGEPCVSLTGVWMFLKGRLVVPDFDEILLDGRRARVVFDSDVTRKPEVSEPSCGSVRLSIAAAHASRSSICPRGPAR